MVSNASDILVVVASVVKNLDPLAPAHLGGPLCRGQPRRHGAPAGLTGLARLGWGLQLFPPSTDCGRFEVKKNRYSASPFWGAIAGAAKVSKGWGRSYPGSAPCALPECDPVGHLGADGDVEGVLVGLGPHLQDVPPWADADSLGLSASAVMQDLLVEPL